VPTSHRIVLARRPLVGVSPDLFRMETVEFPPLDLMQVRLRTLYTSLAPFQRQRLSETRSYVKPFAIGEVVAADNICEVIESRHPDFVGGEVVAGRLGWQTHPVADGRQLTKIDQALAPPSAWLSALGSPGLTAYFALLEFGQPKPDDIVVVTSAAGAVGGFAGQLAALAGARAVGIAGGPRKCDHAVRNCGYAAALDYRATNFKEQLASETNGRVAVFLDLVGGEIADAVFEQLGLRAKVILCGRTAAVNSATPERDFANLRYVWVQEADIHSFSAYAHVHRFPEARTRLAAWLKAGRLRTNEEYVHGLANIPQAFCNFINGQFAGRVIIELE
jgi:NADPH-dependent curcumin reductase CurA